MSNSVSFHQTMLTSANVEKINLNKKIDKLSKDLSNIAYWILGFFLGFIPQLIMYIIKCSSKARLNEITNDISYHNCIVENKKFEDSNPKLGKLVEEKSKKPSKPNRFDLQHDFYTEHFKLEKDIENKQDSARIEHANAAKELRSESKNLILLDSKIKKLKLDLQNQPTKEKEKSLTDLETELSEKTQRLQAAQIRCDKANKLAESLNMEYKQACILFQRKHSEFCDINSKA